MQFSKESRDPKFNLIVWLKEKGCAFNLDMWLPKMTIIGFMLLKAKLHSSRESESP